MSKITEKSLRKCFGCHIPGRHTCTHTYIYSLGHRGRRNTAKTYSCFILSCEFKMQDLFQQTQKKNFLISKAVESQIWIRYAHLQRAASLLKDALTKMKQVQHVQIKQDSSQTTGSDNICKMKLHWSQHDDACLYCITHILHAYYICYISGYLITDTLLH